MPTRFKSKLSFFFLCALLLFPFSSLAEKRPRIVVITHGQTTDPFWLVVRNGVERAAAETGSDVEYRAPEHFDMKLMSKLIDQAVATRPDGLVVSIPDPAALAESIRHAVAAKIPVISINSGPAASKNLGCLMHIGQEEETAGREAGREMKAIGVTKAIILNQEVGNASLDERTRGLKDGFEGPFHQVQTLPVTLDFKQCHDTIIEYLKEYPETDGLIALGPVAAAPALQALRDIGEVGKVKLCTFDTSPQVVQALLKKEMSFALDQQQWLQGYLPVVFLANYIKHGLIPQNKLILTGPNLVTPENAQQLENLNQQSKQENGASGP